MKISLSNGFTSIYFIHQPNMQSTPHNNLNRYPDITANRSNMAKISSKSSQYINANCMTIGQGMVIATQAPLPKTFVHFWSMLWYYRTDLIIMLTKLIEGKKIKAHAYYPTKLNEIARFNNMTVKLISIDHSPQQSSITREFEVFNTDENDGYVVTHIQYTEWPDFGAPADTEHDVIKTIVDTTLTNIIGGSIPIVHCSAGVGRTGVLLTIINYIMENGKYFNRNTMSTNVDTTIANLRKQRNRMVQSTDQYNYILNFLPKYYGLDTPKQNPLSIASDSLDNGFSDIFDFTELTDCIDRTMSMSLTKSSDVLGASLLIKKKIPSKLYHSYEAKRYTIIRDESPLNKACCTLGLAFLNANLEGINLDN